MVVYFKKNKEGNVLLMFMGVEGIVVVVGSTVAFRPLYSHRWPEICSFNMLELFETLILGKS